MSMPDTSSLPALPEGSEIQQRAEKLLNDHVRSLKLNFVPDVHDELNRAVYDSLKCEGWPDEQARFISEAPNIIRDLLARLHAVEQERETAEQQCADHQRGENEALKQVVALEARVRELREWGENWKAQAKKNRDRYERA